MWTGGCLCGAVRFQAEGAPLRVGLCHCRTCRHNTGAPFGAFAIFPRDRFRLLQGETGAYETSAEIRRHFCPRCGAPLFHEEGPEINIHLGALDTPEALRPGYELYAVRRLPWLPQISGIRSHDRLAE